MAIPGSIVRLHLELWKRGLYDGMTSVLDMGAQEIITPKSEFESLTDAAGLGPLDPEEFANLANYPANPRCTARPMYKLLGFKEYASVDMSGEHDALPIDLNFPLDDKYLDRQYDLVTDYGTNEHVFNVGEAYRTMHRLCKPGGLMHIEQCVYGGNGYWNFDVSVLEGMAAANNYEIVYAAFFVNISGGGLVHIPLSRELLSRIDLGNLPFDPTTGPYLGVSYVFRKRSDADFVYPYQYNLQQGPSGIQGYTLQFIPQVPSRTLVPMLSLDGIGTKRMAKMVVSRLMARARRIIRI